MSSISSSMRQIVHVDAGVFVHAADVAAFLLDLRALYDSCTCDVCVGAISALEMASHVLINAPTPGDPQ